MPTDIYLSPRLYWHSAPYFAALGVGRDLSVPAEKGYLGAYGDYQFYVSDPDDPRMVDALPPEFDALFAENEDAAKAACGGAPAGSPLLYAPLVPVWKNHPRYAPGGLYDQLTGGSKRK